MNGGGSLRMLHDSGERIRHFQYEARGELTVRLTGIDQTRRIWDKLASEHHFAHGGKKLVAFFARFGHRNGADDAADDIRPLLERTSLQILQRIPLANDFSGIDSK